jgi:hypothetical protein
MLFALALTLGVVGDALLPVFAPDPPAGIGTVAWTPR